MSTIALLVADDVDDVELRTPMTTLAAEGHDVVLVGREAGEEVHGKYGELAVTTDASAAELDPDAVDALVVPGGWSPDRLRLDPGCVRLVHQVDRAGRPVAAIGHGPSLLIDAAVVSERTLTSWPSIRVDLRQAGARWVDEPVVVDGNLVTSRAADDLPAFLGALLDLVGRPSEAVHPRSEHGG